MHGIGVRVLDFQDFAWSQSSSYSIYASELKEEGHLLEKQMKLVQLQVV